MYMTAKEAAEMWGLSVRTVRRYCSEGIIPTAEKTGRLNAWRIPKGCECPPMARHGLCLLLDNVIQVNEGAKLDFSKCGYPVEKVRAGYSYLISQLYMTDFCWERKSLELGDCRITSRGLKLLEKEESEGKSPALRGRAQVAIRLGVVEAELSGEVSK